MYSLPIVNMEKRRIVESKISVSFNRLSTLVNILHGYKISSYYKSDEKSDSSKKEKKKGRRGVR